MDVTPKLVVENVDPPKELGGTLLGVFSPEEKTELPPGCNIHLDVPGDIGKLPTIKFDPEQLKEIGGISLFRCAFRGSSMDLQCWMKITTRGSKKYLDSVMFSECTCSHDSGGTIAVELADCESDGDTKLDMLAHTSPKGGMKPINEECTLVLMYEKIGAFRINFKLSEAYGCSKLACMHNDYVFENGIEGQPKIRVVITVGYGDNDQLLLSSVQFVSVPDEETADVDEVADKLNDTAI